MCRHSHWARGHQDGKQRLLITEGVHLRTVKPCLPQASQVAQCKEATGRCRDAGPVPGWARSPGGGHGHPPWYSCLESPVDRETSQAAVRGVTKSQTQLSTQHTHLIKAQTAACARILTPRGSHSAALSLIIFAFPLLLLLFTFIIFLHLTKT